MGFFDSFTGKAQKRDLKAANKAADKFLTEGAAGARTELTGGYTGADTFLKNALAAAGAGYGRANADLTSAEGKALGLLDPYMETGTGANALYADALGINGTQRQRAFGDSYAASDPFRAQNQEMAAEGLMRVLNARGMSGSGYAGEAVARQALERGSQDYQNYLDRLFGASQAGQNAASQGAGIASNMGTARANLNQGLGQTRADIFTRRADNSANRGNALANLTYGVAQQRAGRRVGYGNALAESRGIGVNNLLKVAELGVKAAGGMG